MKQINIREALLELDRKTDARYDLTTLYEACKLDDDDKQKLVKYIDAYDHPATINKFLSSKCDAITEALGDDDVSDMKIIDEINDGGDRTLWNLMNKFDDEDLQLKDLKEDIDPEVLAGRLENINFVMSNYVKDSFLIDDVQGSGKEWKVTYNDVTVDVTFDTDWEEYTYYINGKGPYCHSSYEYIASDIANFVDYNHLGQSDDEVDEALGDNRDVHSRTHMDNYDVYCTDCGQVTSHKFKGNFKDGEKELGRYICKECGCENDDDPINESLTEGVDTSNLEPQIKEVVTAVMQENGYEADEIEAYTTVEIRDTVDDMIQVEVRAELGYDDLMELCDKLNPIVAAVDHRAYFEPVTSGIARAFIRNDQSQDIVDEDAVNQWTNKIYDCASMDDLRQVWTAFKDHIDNGQYTDGTVDAVLDEIHKKADMLNESLTEGYMPDDDEYDRIDRNGTDEEQLLAAITYQYGVDMDKAREYEKELTDEEKARAVKYYNLRMLPREVRLKKMNEMLTESYSKGDWVEVNLNTKKNGTPNIIPVKVDSGHGKTFLGWAWGEKQHEYPMSAIVKKIDMDDTDAIIRKYTPSGYMNEKLTLNESDDTDILYDMEDYDEDNTTVTAGNSFIEDGHTWTWFRQCGDTVHLDFDNWAVWWAYRPEIEDDYNSTAISGFFVVDTDTGFIDWGPCDTVKEAQEFLQSKVNDWENDIDESKPVKESYRQDTPDNVYKVGDRVAQRWTDEFNVGTVTDIKEEEGTQYKVEWDYSEGPSVEWLYGTDISLWIEEENIDESKSIKEDVDTMIYLFPELTDEDLDAAKGYGLQFLGKNHGPDGSEDNWVLKGYESSLRMFADKYLGYELHSDYLYNEEDFAGDIVNESLNEDVSSSANSLYDLLKDYGAISVDKDVDVTRISFRNSEDDSDATLVHHCILSKGYKELTQYGNNPNVTEYLNEAGDTCVKLLIYDDSIAVELSAEDSSQYIESVDKDEEGDFVRCPQCDENTFDYKQGKCTKCGHKGKPSEGRCDSIIKNFFGEAVDKDLTHCTECGKKLNDKGYCETEGCPNGTLKEDIDPDFSDDELASIYGGDTKNDIPDGVETPEETEARLAKDNTLEESATIPESAISDIVKEFTTLFKLSDAEQQDFEKDLKAGRAEDWVDFVSIELGIKNPSDIKNIENAKVKEFFSYCNKEDYDKLENEFWNEFWADESNAGAVTDTKEKDNIDEEVRDVQFSGGECGKVTSTPSLTKVFFDIGDYVGGGARAFVDIKNEADNKYSVTLKYIKPYYNAWTESVMFDVETYEFQTLSKRNVDTILRRIDNQLCNARWNINSVLRGLPVSSSNSETVSKLTEARLAKESALKESTRYVVVKADGTYAGVPCETEEEARELSNQHEGSKVHKIEG